MSSLDSATIFPAYLTHHFLSAPQGLVSISQVRPRLAPWAGLFRRFAAASLLSDLLVDEGLPVQDEVDGVRDIVGCGLAGGEDALAVGGDGEDVYVWGQS